MDFYSFFKTENITLGLTVTCSTVNTSWQLESAHTVEFCHFYFSQTHSLQCCYYWSEQLGNGLHKELPSICFVIHSFNTHPNTRPHTHAMSIHSGGDSVPCMENRVVNKMSPCRHIAHTLLGGKRTKMY